MVIFIVSNPLLYTHLPIKKYHLLCTNQLKLY